MPLGSQARASASPSWNWPRNWLLIISLIGIKHVFVTTKAVYSLDGYLLDASCLSGVNGLLEADDTVSNRQAGSLVLFVYWTFIKWLNICKEPNNWYEVGTLILILQIWRRRPKVTYLGSDQAGVWVQGECSWPPTGWSLRKPNLRKLHMLCDKTPEPCKTKHTQGKKRNTRTTSNLNTAHVLMTKFHSLYVCR